MTGLSPIPKKPREIANETEAVQDGRIHIEKINGPFPLPRRWLAS
jgi:hypothetical protein